MSVLCTYEYHGKTLQLVEDVQPPAKPRVVLPQLKAPGAGKIELVGLRLSADQIAPGAALTLTAQVTGRQIAYIYSELLLWDEALNQAYGPVAREYVAAPRNKLVRGASRPDWDETTALSLVLSPSLRLVSAGDDLSFGFLLPEGYGSTNYRLEGRFASADGTRQARVRVVFGANGETQSVLAFKEPAMQGSAPRALSFSPGDCFTPLAQVITPPVGDQVAWQMKKCLATPLTLRETGLRWVSELPLPGVYLVGLVVQDLDGGLTRQYARLTVGG